MDPFGGVTPMVDKMIGDAYPNVEIVAKNIDAVVNVAAEIEDVVNVSNNTESMALVLSNVEAMNIVSTNIDAVVLVSGSIDSVNVVSTDIDSVKAVSQNMTTVDHVSQNMAAVSTVSLNIGAVTTVANNETEINDVATNMDAVVLLSENINLIENNPFFAFVSGVAPALGASVNIPFPAGVTLANIRSSAVMIISTLAGTAYFPGAEFTVKIVGNQLVVTIAAGAPANIVGGAIRWQITYSNT